MHKVLLLFIFILLSACTESTPALKKISQNAVILSFGDSLTYGTGASRGADYPSILSSLSSHEVINAGVPGELTDAGLNRLGTLLDEYSPELLILIHGGNDMLRKVSQQQTRHNLKQMIALANQRNINVVMLGVPKPGLLFLSSSDLYQQVADTQKVPIDLDTLPKILSNKHLKSDPIHPNDKGYKLMAENIFNFLIETGAL